MPIGNFFSSNPAFQQSLNDEMQRAANQKRQLEAAAAAAGGFAGQGEAGYGAMTAEMAADRERLRRLASGQDSISAEQLRQGLQQNLAAQRSMAASASPQNAVMAARNAANNMNRAGIGMSGQAAIAGLQERQQAGALLGQMNLQQRGQDIEVGLGSRQNQMTGLGASKPDKPKQPGTTDRLLAAGAAIAPLFSDVRLKDDVRDGDKAARRALETLGAKVYKYKSERHGKGEQIGFLAQDLEKVAPDAIIETDEGKAINPGKLSGLNTAMVVALGKRVAKLERK